MGLGIVVGLRRGALLIATLALGLVLAAPAAAATLAGALGAQMKKSSRASGAFVVDAATGKTLYALRQGDRRMPASVEKLWTTSTALTRLGPNFRLKTRVLARADLGVDGVLQGDLFLKGGGDPTLGDYGIRVLADDLYGEGLRKISGSVVGDESYLDARRGVPSSDYGWSPDVEPLSALTYLRNVSHGYVLNPPLNAAQGFAQALKAKGITIAKSARAARTPSGARQLAALNSIPLKTLVQRTNTPSDNFYAETLVKDLGRRLGGVGSTTAGARVVHAQALEFGAKPTMVDGSGLSRRDRSSPRQIVTLLRAMRTNGAFRSSLAIAGRTGTLADRMRGTAAQSSCRAKTGTLHDVSALAGYCFTRSGRTLAFAILMNRVYPTSARNLQDAMAVAMVTKG